MPQLRGNEPILGLNIFTGTLLFIHEKIQSYEGSILPTDSST
jgi:hypothetical protein